MSIAGSFHDVARKIRYNFSFPQWQSVGNCGASLLSGFSGSATGELPPATAGGSGWGKVPAGNKGLEPPSLEEWFYALDQCKAVLLNPYFLESCPGFYIITDNIIRERSVWSFSTRDFVDYIISRKLGVVTRSLIALNRNYKDRDDPRYGSAITCWVWCANTKLLISPDTESFVPEGVTPETANKKNPTVTSMAMKFVEKTRKLSSAGHKSAKTG